MIEDAPSGDTIRYQLKKLKLLEQSTPRSALMPDDLAGHCRGLNFMALVLRNKLTDPGWATKTWTGFSPGQIGYPEAEGEEELEINEQWTDDVDDPRDISQFRYLLAHLESTPDGHEVAVSITGVFFRAQALKKSAEQFQELAYTSVKKSPLSATDEQNNTVATSIFNSLRPAGSREKLRRARNSRSRKQSVDPVLEGITK